MPRVFIPVVMRSLTGGRDVVEATGGDVRRLIEDLDRRFPGCRDRLCDGQKLRPGLSVVVGGMVAGAGLRQRVEADDEVHFVPAIAGGRQVASSNARQ